MAEIAVNKSKAAVAMAPGGQADILIKPWEARELLGLKPIPDEPPEGAKEAFGEGGVPPLDGEEDEPLVTIPPALEETG